MYQAFMLFIRRTIGIVLLLIGLIGLFIPLVPIWMSLIPGIALLGAKDPLIRSLHLKMVTNPQINQTPQNTVDSSYRTHDIYCIPTHAADCRYHP